jgi:hypothetical protein
MVTWRSVARALIDVALDAAFDLENGVLIDEVVVERAADHLCRVVVLRRDVGRIIRMADDGVKELGHELLGDARDGVEELPHRPPRIDVGE